MANKIILNKYSRWLTEAIEEESQDKRPLKVKLASWANRVWDQHQDERVTSYISLLDKTTSDNSYDLRKPFTYQAIIGGVLGFWFSVGIIGWMVLLVLWIQPRHLEKTKDREKKKQKTKIIKSSWEF